MSKSESLRRLKPNGKSVRRPRAEYPAAGTSSPRVRGWRPGIEWPNQNLGSLETLRRRSRAAVEGNGFASGIIEARVNNIVGTGIKPLSQAGPVEALDPADILPPEWAAFRRAVHALWKRWTDESDADGRSDFYGQQRQAVRCMLEAGEVFVRLRDRLPTDGLSVPMQVQVLEPEMCPHTYNVDASNGNRVRAGIEFDRIGRRVAYYFFASRPGDPDDWQAADLRRIPAESVLHVYDAKRAGLLRGIPVLTAALIRLRSLDKFDDATLNRQMLSNMFAMFVRNSGGGGLEALTGHAPDTDPVTDQPLARLEPGVVQELLPGQEVQFSDPPDIVAGFVDFLRYHLRAAGAAAGVPYEVFTGDLSQVNDRTVRVILYEFRRRIESEQHQTVAFQLCRPVWERWMDRAFLFQALPIPVDYATDSEPWLRVNWVPQGWKYINPVQDVAAAKDAIRNGLTSRSAAVAEAGEDAEMIDAEQAADNARADRLKLSYDSDGRKPGNGGAAPAAAPPPATPPRPAPNRESATPTAPEPAPAQ